MSSDRSRPLSRSGFHVFRPIQTRWADNDIYGHINNVAFYAYFDTAVNSWLNDAGLLDIDHGDIIGLVVETGCQYFSPAAFPDALEAGLRVARIGTSSVQYEVAIFKSDEDTTMAQGRFVHVYVDRQTRRPVALPDSWRTALSGLQMQPDKG